MSLAAQKQLAKGYEARDMQYGGRREVVQLEAIELHKPDTIQQVHGIWRRTRLAMPKTIYAPDS